MRMMMMMTMMNGSKTKLTQPSTKHLTRYNDNNVRLSAANRAEEDNINHTSKDHNDDG